MMVQRKDLINGSEGSGGFERASCVSAEVYDMMERRKVSVAELDSVPLDHV